MQSWLDACHHSLKSAGSLLLVAKVAEAGQTLYMVSRDVTKQLMRACTVQYTFTAPRISLSDKDIGFISHSNSSCCKSRTALAIT